MSQWRITRGDEQFVAKDLAELKIWAASGKIKADDLIQAPGSSEWTYATETAELQGLLRRNIGDGLTEDDFQKQRSEKTLRQIVLVMAGLGVVVAFGVMIMVAMNPPDPKDKDLKDGKFALDARDALVTRDCALRQSPSASATAVTNLTKDTRVTLQAKHDRWYEVAAPGDRVGYLSMDDIIPGYYLAKDEHKKWDPIYNPEHYLDIHISDWQVVMDDFKPQETEHLTLLAMTITNTCTYDMKDIVMDVHFWDPAVKVNTEQLTLEEVVPAHGSLYHELEFEVDIIEVPRATIDILGARVIDPPIR
jgi:hypothetical protein